VVLGMALAAFLGMVLAAILGMALAALLSMVLAAILVTLRGFVAAARPVAASAAVVTMVMVVLMVMMVRAARVFVMVTTPLVAAMCVTGALGLPSRCLSRYPQRICR